MSAVEERVRAGGLFEPATAVVVLLSGGRDSVCLLDLAVRLGGPVTALHVNYGLRDRGRRGRGLCAALCERLGAGFEVTAAAPSGGKPAGLGARRALRGGGAARARRRRGGCGRSHGDRSGRDRALPPRRVAGPARAARDAGARRAPHPAAADDDARGDRRALHRARPAVARGPHECRPRSSRATASATS